MRLFPGKILSNYFILFFFGGAIVCQSQWQSQKVYFGLNGKLVYSSDSEGNRIPDFSYAGYMNGEKQIPIVPVVKTITAVAGDNTQNIQNAVNEVGKFQLIDGIRGALLLKAGKYEVNGSIAINYSGVVLRGEGDGDDPSTNTIIYGKGNIPDQRTIITAGGGKNTRWSGQVAGTKTNILTQKIFTGDKNFQIQNPMPYKVGDNIIIVHSNTDTWLQSVNYGSPASDPKWTTSDNLVITYNRFIKKINNDTITIDAPVFYTLDRSLSQAYIYKYDRSGILQNIGIENLRVDIEIPGNDLNPKNASGNEAHAWEAVELIQIEDSWVKNCTMIHFGHSGVMTSTATRITIENCNAIDPISNITGERRYNFNMYHSSQLVLVKNCFTRYGRHDYVSNGTASVSGCVFYNCLSEGIYNASEGHRWWSQGLLYDNITFTNPNTSFVLALYNRGDYGTSHGWASVNSVAWRCIVNGGKNIIIQKPPTAQNYAIGCFANLVSGKTPPAPFNQPEGYIEGSNLANLNPQSLYMAQLNERLSIGTGIGETRPLMNESFILFQNYPNPFNPETIISYNLPVSSRVSLKVYDVLGREISTLVDEFQSAGTYSSQFPPSRASSILNSQLPSGVYIYELSHNGNFLRKKMQCIK